MLREFEKLGLDLHWYSSRYENLTSYKDFLIVLHSDLTNWFRSSTFQSTILLLKLEVKLLYLFETTKNMSTHETNLKSKIFLVGSSLNLLYKPPSSLTFTALESSTLSGLFFPTLSSLWRGERWSVSHDPC